MSLRSQRNTNPANEWDRSKISSRFFTLFIFVIRFCYTITKHGWFACVSGSKVCIRKRNRLLTVKSKIQAHRLCLLFLWSDIISSWFNRYIVLCKYVKLLHWHWYNDMVVQNASITVAPWSGWWRLKSPASRPVADLFVSDEYQISKLRVSGLCEGNPLVPGGMPSQRASNTKKVSIWWRHHETREITVKDTCQID